MDSKTLAEVMDNRVSMARYEELAPHFNAGMRAADVTTERRATMWCAQIGHESGGLRYMEEIADGSAYEWREDLGNNQPGDGRRYKGRGPIQLTGRDNYTAFSRWAFDKGLSPSPTFFVDNPGEVSEPAAGFLAAAFYWTVRRNMNSYADRDDLIGATIAVNGGTTHIDDRRAFWYRAGAVGDRVLPSPAPTVEGGSVSTADDILTQFIGPERAGWEFLGESVPAAEAGAPRHNYAVEAIGDIRKSLLTKHISFVEQEFLVDKDGNPQPPLEMDLATIIRFADYQAFHAARLAGETAKKLDAQAEQLDRIEALLTKLVGDRK